MHYLMIFIFPAIKTCLQSIAMDDAQIASQSSQSGLFVFRKTIGARGKIESLLSSFDNIRK